MSLPTKTRCKHPDCNAPLAFGLTAKGKRMPLWPEPVVFAEGELRSLRGLQVFEDRIQIRQATVDDELAGTPIYRPHFDGCPGSASFRRTS